MEKIVRQAILLIFLIPLVLFSQIIEDKTQNKTSRNLYTKISLITGSGSDDILVGRVDYTDSEKESEDIYIDPGGGTGLEAIIGYDITNSLSFEFALGWCNTGETVDGDNNILFNRAPVRATILYYFDINKKWTPYIGGGLSSNLSVKHTEETSGRESEIKYKTPTGFHFLGGMEFKNKNSPWFWYGELRIIRLGEYVVDESDFPTSILNEFGMETLDANGFQFSIGAGYYIN